MLGRIGTYLATSTIMVIITFHHIFGRRLIPVPDKEEHIFFILVFFYFTDSVSDRCMDYQSAI
jgi:hypothetical protein